MTFYERLELLRKSMKKSQRDLETELGFSNGSYSKWKNSIPTHDRLIKLADYFGVSTEYLINGEEPSNRERAKIDAIFARQNQIIKEYMLKFANLPEEKRNQIMSLIDMLEEK